MSGAKSHIWYSEILDKNWGYKMSMKSLVVGGVQSITKGLKHLRVSYGVILF